MKKLGMLSLIVGSLWLGACSDDDKDFMLDVNRMQVLIGITIEPRVEIICLSRMKTCWK